MKQNFFLILKVTEERIRIRNRIHLSEVRIRGSRSAPKCHGSPTLATMPDHDMLSIPGTFILYFSIPDPGSKRLQIQGETAPDLRIRYKELKYF